MARKLAAALLALALAALGCAGCGKKDPAKAYFARELAEFSAQAQGVRAVLRDMDGDGHTELIAVGRRGGDSAPEELQIMVYSYREQGGAAEGVTAVPPADTVYLSADGKVITYAGTDRDTYYVYTFEAGKVLAEELLETSDYSGRTQDEITYAFNGIDIPKETYEAYLQSLGILGSAQLYPEGDTGGRALLPDDTQKILAAG